VVARNVRTPFGEVDLVAEDRKKTLVFCEVKSRSAAGFGAGLEAVTRRQAERVRRAGLACAQALGRPDAALRFDVLAVTPAREGAPASVEHFEDAF
ncbi:MAG TPA: YraN family protein, partial [Planctomycetota bacterium]|nr:YraN family protein [Planctomycetota bacterium]